MSVEQLASQEITPELRALEAITIPLDSTERADQLRTVTGEGVISLLDTIHRIVAADTSHEPNPVPTKLKDPEGNITGILAAPENRRPIFDYAAQKVRELSAVTGPAETQQFLNRAADTLAVAVVLAHPYKDGNGRSARTIAQLVRYGLDTSNQRSIDDMMLVSANRPTQGFRINGYIPRGDVVGDKTPCELIERIARTDIPLAETSRYISQRQAEFSTPYSD